MQTFRVTFYIQNVPVDDGEVLIQAEDAIQAEQVLLLHLNSNIDVPSIWDRYSAPVEVIY